MANEVIKKFKGKIVRNTYSAENYKIYAVEIDKREYPDIKVSEEYGTASIQGDLHELGIGIEYIIEAKEVQSKYGFSYKVINIHRDRPITGLDTKIFLQEVLTAKQAEVLFEAYPNIIDLVIQNKLEDIDLSKLYGIGSYTFEKIKEKIINNFALAELISELKGSLSLSIVRKLYNKYPSVNKIKSKLKSEPYDSLCDISGIGFKTADMILLDMEKNNILSFEHDLKTSESRCLACMKYLLEQNELDGNTKMTIIELAQQVKQLAPSCYNHFGKCLLDNKIYCSKTTKTIGLKNTYNTEKYILQSVLECLKYSNGNIWDYDVTKYQQSEQFVLTEEQLNAISNVCKYNISILNGYSGTGKSSSINALIRLLEDNNKSFTILAPTGRAAKVISEYTHKTASTIHRGLGYIPPSEWIFNIENKLDTDIVIIDEFSMCDIWLFKHLIDAVNLQKTKILLIGDSAQLPSVGCGNLLQDFIDLSIIPTTSLNKIFRYCDGGLMKVATDVRLGKRYLTDDINEINFYGINKDYAFIPSSTENICTHAVALYKKLLTQNYAPKDIQILSAYNKGECGTKKLNSEIQKVANSNYNTNNYIEVGDVKYYKDDIVIQTANNYKARVYNPLNLADDNEFDVAFIANGETGVVVEVSKTKAVIDFNGSKVLYNKNDLFNVSLGYSISIHKSQGGNCKIIILITPQSHIFMLNSNLIYVGLTRMTERCFHLGSANAVNKAVKKKANKKRHTFMNDIYKYDLKKL